MQEMPPTRSRDRNAMSATLERLVCDEFELMEVCQDAAGQTYGENRARLLHQARLCQVHLSDLESSLRELAGRSASYSSCVRRALGILGAGSWRRSLDKLSRRYERALGQRHPEGLNELLRTNMREHREVALRGEELWRSA